MQITRQADYALRAMIYLSGINGNTRAATSQIAKEKVIPPSFLAKIISQLSIAGLIHTSRGARGGVTLARPSTEITILEVIEAIDGPIGLNECTISKNGCPFDHNCPIHPVWIEAQNELIKKLSSTTFASLVAENHKE